MRMYYDTIFTSIEERPERDFETSSSERSELSAKHAGTTTVLQRRRCRLRQKNSRNGCSDMTLQRSVSGSKTRLHIVGTHNHLINLMVLIELGATCHYVPLRRSRLTALIILGYRMLN